MSLFSMLVSSGSLEGGGGWWGAATAMVGSGLRGGFC